MKKHPRILKLVTKLLVGHSMMFVDKFADDFAKYRTGTSDLHPALLAAFKRFEKHFGVAFKHRRFIEQNHKLHTGIFGPALLAILSSKEDGTPQGGYYPGGKKQTFYVTPPVSKTLH